MRNDRRLETLASKIIAAEKGSVQNIIAIGGWLEQAYAACPHGEFLSWVDSNFHWSYRTCQRYRAAHRFAKSCRKFKKLSLSVTAFYALVDCDDEALRDAVVDQAMSSGARLTARAVHELISDIQHPQPDPSDSGADEEADENADDDTGKQDDGGTHDDEHDGEADDDGDHSGDSGDPSDDTGGKDADRNEEDFWADDFRACVSRLESTLHAAPSEKAWVKAVDLTGSEIVRQLASQLQLVAHRHEAGHSVSKVKEALRSRADRAAATSEERRKKT